MLSKNVITIFVVVFSFFAFALSKSPPKLTGEHICHREEKFVKIDKK